MTTYYTPSGNPLTLSRGASSLPRAEFTAIAAGFTAVDGTFTATNAAIALKGNITTQTWLGTHAFPATTSIGNVSSNEIGYLDGVTSAIQGQIDGKGAIAGQAWSGAHNFTAGTITVPTIAPGTNSSDAASMAALLAATLTFGATAWVSGATYALYDTAIAPSNAQVYRRIVAGAGTTDPALDSTNWTAAFASPSIIRSTRTGNTILGTTDNQKLIDITSGTFSQTFTAAATLGTGWHCYVRHSGTGRITLDPDGAELIDGLASFIMYPGETRLIQCDGTGFNSVVLTPFNATLTATEVITRPPGYTLFGGLLSGGGGGGGRSNAGGVTVGGGGGGACNPFALTATQFGASQTITIGAGGTAQTGVGNGGVGGTSSIGTLCYAYGGGGGGGAGTDVRGGGGGGSLSAGSVGTASAGAGGGPGVAASTATHTGSGLGGAYGATGTASYADSAYGGAGGGYTTTAGGIAGNSVYGGGGGAGVSNANVASTGGTSQYGGAGGASSVAGNGTAGAVGGGGGGATQTGTTSGAGGAGRCIIWGIA